MSLVLRDWLHLYHTCPVASSLLIVFLPVLSIFKLLSCWLLIFNYCYLSFLPNWSRPLSGEAPCACSCSQLPFDGWDRPPAALSHHIPAPCPVKELDPSLSPTYTGPPAALGPRNDLGLLRGTLGAPLGPGCSENLLLLSCREAWGTQPYPSTSP